MISQARPSTFTVVVEAGDETSAGELDAMTRQLLTELRGADAVQAVEPVTEVAPEGTRALDAAVVGSLMVAVVPAFVEKLVDFLVAWAKRTDSRTVTIKTQVDGETIEVSFNPQAISPEQIKNLVDMLRPGKGREAQES